MLEPQNNFQLELNDVVTPYVEGYRKSSPVKSHYKEYLMDVYVHNSFMQFCEGDELLKVPSTGMGGGVYDLKFTDQFGQMNICIGIGTTVEDTLPVG